MYWVGSVSGWVGLERVTQINPWTTLRDFQAATVTVTSGPHRRPLVSRCEYIDRRICPSTSQDVGSPQELRPPSSAHCRDAQLVAIDGRCCREWVCPHTLVYVSRRRVHPHTSVCRQRVCPHTHSLVGPDDNFRKPFTMHFRLHRVAVAAL